VGGQEWESGESLGAVPSVPPVGSRGKAPGEGLKAWPPEADDTFCENIIFCHGDKNDIAIFAFIAYKCSI